MRKGEHSAKRFTPRGFADYAAVVDGYGQTVTVRQSSAVDPAVWIFCKGADGKDVAQVSDYRGDSTVALSPHLRPHQALRVALALLGFCDETNGTKTKVTTRKVRR